MKQIIFILYFFLISCKTEGFVNQNNQFLQTGAEQFNEYLPELLGKSVAVCVNHTSVVKNTHLVDTLLSQKVLIKKIFTPEHGFRGDADAGETVKSSKDSETGLPVVSLYGNNKKPKPEDLKDVDVVVFDLQDVGVRFFTYISTMHYLMEACAENKVKLIVLDRPNPNGDYVDGPVLEDKYKSFVGMHPIPIVHGLTVGELAEMINGEKWLKEGVSCDLEVVKVKNYSHKDKYVLPVKPSPNLPNQQSILLYPSVCLFEGTKISVGRGTYDAFQVIGYPDPAFGSFTFMPVSITGMAKTPPYENQVCYGSDLRSEEPFRFSLEYLIEYYKKSPFKETFFNNYFNTLAGNAKLQQQIKQNITEDEIRKSWQQNLLKFKNTRKKYLLYPDFE